MTPILTVENLAGPAIPYRSNTLVPFTQVWHLKLPWIKGGLIWNRPVSVVVQEADQQERIVPVQDITRQMLWLLFGLSLTSALLALLANPNQHRRQSSKLILEIEESNP
jgi:hypothetical protein